MKPRVLRVEYESRKGVLRNGELRPPLSAYCESGRVIKLMFYEAKRPPIGINAPMPS
jgi:hypothetical protein